MNKIHTLEPGNEEITAKKIITVSDARLNFFQVFYSQLLQLSCVLYSMIFFGFISSFRNQYNHRCFKEQITTNFTLYLLQPFLSLPTPRQCWSWATSGDNLVPRAFFPWGRGCSRDSLRLKLYTQGMRRLKDV